MKKWFVALAGLIILVVAGVYVFIPKTLIISQVIPVHSTISGASRLLSADDNWEKWLPGNDSAKSPGHITDGGSFPFGEDKYKITQHLYDGAEIKILHKNSELTTRINLLPLNGDSLAIQWECSMPSGNNPLNRISGYREAVKIRAQMTNILNRLRSYLEDNSHVYGLFIKESSTKDTLLIVTKSILDHYPSTTEIYRLINTLKSYSIRQKAKQTGYPMMNVTNLDSNHLQLMVALPVDKEIEENGMILRRRMVPGKFLISDVSGGPAAVRRAFYQMQLYFEDHKRTTMAIPFASLITDRSSEPDSTKWITRIYAPVY